MYRRKPGGNWYISVGGIRKSAGTRDRARAKRREQKENAEAWDRHHGLSIPTWEQAALSWSKAYPKEAAIYANRKFAKWWLPKLKGKRLVLIGREFIHSTIVKHRPEVDLEHRAPANATANGYVGFVSRIIRHGSNLNPKFIRYPPIKFRERWLTPEEWWAIRPHFKPDERDMVTWFLATGVREANGMFMQWKWDRGTYGLLPPADTKTDTPYGLPWNKTAQAILARRRAAAVKHLKYPFTIEGKDWYPMKLLRAVRRACGASGVEKVTVHGLRHTFATWLAQRGVAKEIRERLMGHCGKDTQDGYSHFNVESLRPYVEIIDSILMKPVRGAAKSSHTRRKTA